MPIHGSPTFGQNSAFPIDDGCPPRFLAKSESLPGQETSAPVVSPLLPSSAVEAMARGAWGRCPRCKEAKLFLRFLKPRPHCPHCGQDWTHQQADDFPAYVSILVTGHVLAPLIIMLVRDTELSIAALASIVLILAMTLLIGLLQPAKGAIIALQWWFGMHGFVKERPTVVDGGSGS